MLHKSKYDFFIEILNLQPVSQAFIYFNNNVL